MRVTIERDADAFAAQAWALLAADEANHTHLLAAIAQRHNCDPTPAEPWHAALVHDAGGAVRAAARRHERIWFLSTGTDAALEALGRALRDDGMAGVKGDAAAVRAFERGHGGAMQLHFDLPLFRLDGEPQWPAPADAAALGSLRRATADDLAPVLALAESFRVEARLPDSAQQVAAAMPRRLAAGTLYLWLDAAGEPTGLIGGLAIPPSGARVGPVYTRPERRGHGIGAAMVATLAHQLRAGGARCLFLFTDATNPTSNALYTRLGFMPAGRHVHLTVAR